MPRALSRGNSRSVACAATAFVAAGIVVVTSCVAVFVPTARAAAVADLPVRSQYAVGAERTSASTPTMGVGAMAVCGALFMTAALSSPVIRSRTARKYTTQTILPSLVWYPTGVSAKELDGGVLLCVCLEGIDVVLGKTGSGKVFAVADKCPPIGTSLSVGGEIIGDEVIDPQYGTAFNVFTGQPDKWCTSPPIIGGLISTIMGGPQALKVFDCKTIFFGGDVEVLIDTNMRRAYEANYWKGVLDAQGKDDGTYY